MSAAIKLVGFEDLERSLVEEFPKATSKNILKRTAIGAMKRIENRAKELAPKQEGALAASIATKQVKAKRSSRTRFEAQSGVTVATGPTSRKPDGPGGNASWQEFGTVKMAANPFMRPAADGELPGVLDHVKAELALQIEKARKRIARKAARGR